MVSPIPSGKRTALLVATADVSTNLLNEILEPRGFAPVAVVSTLAELAVRMRVLQPSIVIAPVESAGQGGDFDAITMELRRLPGCVVIGTSRTKDADIVLAAMRAGVLEFLVTPAEPAEVRATIGRVLQLTASPTAQGQVFTVYAAKGGLGTSTIAASLAWELARDANLRVAAFSSYNDSVMSGVFMKIPQEQFKKGLSTSSAANWNDSSGFHNDRRRHAGHAQPQSAL